MALVVEDGTGLSTATGYITVAFFNDFCTVEGLTVFPHNETKVEHAIQRATRYLDTRFDFQGYRAVTTQALAWPRTNAYYWDGRAALLVPVEVQEACAFYAHTSLSSTLAPSPTYDESGNRIVRKVERVGPITRETEFGQDGRQPTFRKYPAADQRLRELIVTGNRLLRA